MGETWTRRALLPVAVALAVLLTTAVAVVVDRLSGPAPSDVLALDEPYQMMTILEPRAPAAAKPAPRVVRPATKCPAAPALPTTGATAAIASGNLLHVFDRPDGRLAMTLTNPTRENQRLHVLVRETRGFWYRVQLPIRPNGSTGWVRITEVTTFPAPYRILVQLCAHKITVYRSGRVVWQRPVAVGKPSTPTPQGQFYLDFITTMRPSGAYGPYLLSVAAFSNVLHQYGNGGNGQIALHGTNRPGLVGSSVSHGCVRLRNADITALANMVPPGTPVTITT